MPPPWTPPPSPPAPPSMALSGASKRAAAGQLTALSRLQTPPGCQSTEDMLQQGPQQRALQQQLDMLNRRRAAAAHAAAEAERRLLGAMKVTVIKREAAAAVAAAEEYRARRAAQDAVERATAAADATAEAAAHAIWTFGDEEVISGTDFYAGARPPPSPFTAAGTAALTAAGALEEGMVPGAQREGRRKGDRSQRRKRGRGRGRWERVPERRRVRRGSKRGPAAAVLSRQPVRDRDLTLPSDPTPLMTATGTDRVFSERLRRRADGQGWTRTLVYDPVAGQHREQVDGAPAPSSTQSAFVGELDGHRDHVHFSGGVTPGDADHSEPNLCDRLPVTTLQAIVVDPMKDTPNITNEGDDDTVSYSESAKRPDPDAEVQSISAVPPRIPPHAQPTRPSSVFAEC